MKASVPVARAATGIRTLSAGHSNETYYIEGADIILRLAPDGIPLLDALDVPGQAGVLQAVQAQPDPPPAPVVIYRDDRGDLIGEPFYLMERLTGRDFGDVEVPDWLAALSPDDHGDMCRQFAVAMAKIHAIPPQDVLGPVKTPHEEVGRWHALAIRAGQQPLLDEFDRLLALPLPPAAAPSLVHGDTKPGNTLWDGRTLTAMLDWEMAFNGDPRFDIGYTLQFFNSPLHTAGNPGCDLPGMWDRDAMLAEWARMTGRSTEGIEWFEAATVLKLGAIMAHGLYLCETGLGADERMRVWQPAVDILIATAKTLLDDMDA
ncbi:MAG: phosphotransferase family protein [Sphingobium sp.]